MDAAIKVGVDVARALTYSHQQKFLHCDIKPTNILITPDGRSMLFDFNLSARSNSKTGRIGGTLPYMPPEQLQALVDSNYDFQPTPACDIYSFGVTLYQLLTGKLPFGDIPESGHQRDSAKLLLERQTKTEISFVGVKGINSSLKNLITDCLAFEPEARPHSAAEVTRRLEREQRVVKRTRRWVLTHPVQSVLALVLMLALIPSSLWIHHYFTDVRPRQQVMALMEKGKKAESQFQFTPAITHYRKAIEIAEFDPDVVHHVLCHLAIVYAKASQSTYANQYVSRIKEEFPAKKIINMRVELAVIGATDRLTDDHVARSIEIGNELFEAEALSLNDQNNVLAVEVRIWTSKRLKTTYERLKPKFEKILDESPNHFFATYNLYRILRNRERTTKRIDDTHLKESLELFGDHPVLVKNLLRNAAADLDEGKMSFKDFTSILDRYVACGGEKSPILFEVSRIRDAQKREQVNDYFSNLKFSEVDHDRFIHLGIANPLAAL